MIRIERDEENKGLVAYHKAYPITKCVIIDSEWIDAVKRQCWAVKATITPVDTNLTQWNELFIFNKANSRDGQKKATLRFEE